MPNRRTPERLALLFAACAAALALAAVPRQTSRACPVDPPSPLRLLYKRSDLVAVVRAGDTVPASAGKAQDKADDDQKEDDTDEVGMVRTTLQVTKTLKGEGRGRGVSLYHYQEGEDVDEAFKSGTKLLVFLTRRESGGYAPTDYRYAVKNLSEDDLKVYLRRIEELSAIESREKPDPAEIAEWLVRCAEEPATRWEGAYELALRVDVSMSEEEEPAAAPSPEEQSEGGGSSDVSAAAASSQSQLVSLSVLAPDARAEEESDFAALLTPAQKGRLATALFNTDKLGEGEFTLLPLVATWHDARLAPFMLRRLQDSADNPPREDEMIMMIAARALGDKVLVKFAAAYYSDSTYEDMDGDDSSAPCADDDCKKAAEERRVAALDARTLRSSRVYQFLVLAQQPQKSADKPR